MKSRIIAAFSRENQNKAQIGLQRSAQANAEAISSLYSVEKFIDSIAVLEDKIDWGIIVLDELPEIEDQNYPLHSEAAKDYVANLVEKYGVDRRTASYLVEHIVDYTKMVEFGLAEYEARQ